MAILTETQRQRTRVAQKRAIQSGRISKNLMRMVCCDCIYDTAEKGGLNAQIQGCSVESCVLHPLRHIWAGE